MNRRSFIQATSAAAVTAALKEGRAAETLAPRVFVHPQGDDAHAGGPVTPVATLPRALELARIQKSKAGVPASVLLHPGYYELAETLHIHAGDGGSATLPLRIQSVGNGATVLSGGTRLSLQWEPFRDGIFRAAVPRGSGGDQLFINGNRQVLARYPNFDPTARYLNGTSADAISRERVQRWKNPAGAYVHAMQKSLWGSLHYRVTGIAPDGTLAMEGGWQVDRDQPMHPDLRFVEGIFEELDAPGEWFLDGDTSTLYFFPPAGLDLKSAQVELVRLKTLIEIGSQEGETVRGIELRGLTFQRTLRTFMETREQLLRSDWRIARCGALQIENAEDIRCEDCVFDQSGGNAIFVSGHARRIAVRSSHIYEAGASGVCFVGRPSAQRDALLGYTSTMSLSELDRTPGPKSEEYPANCAVEDCLIERTGRVEKQTAGVEISASRNIRITSCSIYGVPRAGINIGDGSWGGHLVEHCDVFDTVLETSDHGAFNAWGRDRWWHLKGADQDDLMTGNLRDLPTLDTVAPITLRRSRWACAHGWDIDLDDGSSNYRISENLCLCGGIKLREGFLRHATDNITVNNTFHIHVWPAHSSDVVERNIVFTPYRPVRPHGWGDSFDFNFLHIAGQSSARPATELQSLSGQDIHSLAGDAHFVGPARGDYSLLASSPAKALGISSLHLMSYGVRSTRLRRIAKTPDFAAWLRTTPATLAITRRRDAVQWMGATVRNLVGMGEMSEKGAPAETGVIIESVPSNTPAAVAGLISGDLLLTVNETNVATTEQLLSLTHNCSRGSELPLHGLRQQQPFALKLHCP